MYQIGSGLAGIGEMLNEKKNRPAGRMSDHVKPEITNYKHHPILKVGQINCWHLLWNYIWRMRKSASGP